MLLLDSFSTNGHFWWATLRQSIWTLTDVYLLAGTYIHRHYQLTFTILSCHTYNGTISMGKGNLKDSPTPMELFRRRRWRLSYLPNCQSNLVITLDISIVLYCHKYSSLSLGRYEPSSPVSFSALGLYMCTINVAVYIGRDVKIFHF